MPCGRSDTPFRRRRFLHRDTSLSSTRFPWVHRTDKACVRTSWTLGLPLQIHPFQLHPASATTPELVRRSAFDRSGPDEGEEGGQSIRVVQLLASTSSGMIACRSPNLPLR